jgi:hypothetical protein
MASFSLRDPKVQRMLIAGIVGAGSLYVFFGTTLLPVTYPVAAEQIQGLKADYE